MSPQGVPLSIGPYAVSGIWAENRHFITFRAFHIKLKVEVLIHVEKDAPIPDPNDPEVFAESYERWRRFHHAHVAEVRDVGDCGRNSWIVVEFPGGQAVDQLPACDRRNGHLLTRWMASVADAMAEAPEPARWLFPHSVVIDDNGLPWLVDLAATGLFLRAFAEPIVPPPTCNWGVYAWSKFFYDILTEGSRESLRTARGEFPRDVVSVDLKRAGLPDAIHPIVADTLARSPTARRWTLREAAAICHAEHSG